MYGDSSQNVLTSDLLCPLESFQICTLVVWVLLVPALQPYVMALGELVTKLLPFLTDAPLLLLGLAPAERLSIEEVASVPNTSGSCRIL